MMDKDNSPISISSRHHNACHTQIAKSPFLCLAAIAKSNSEDNPVQRIMETSAVADIQEISIMKKGFGKSPNAVFIALTVVSGLLVAANSYAEDITVSKTIPNH